MKKRIRQTVWIFAAVVLLLSGCQKQEKKSVRLVVTGGLASDELFKVNQDVMTVPEAKILLMTGLAKYRNLYGDGVLQETFGDQTLEDSVKEKTLTLLGEIMIMDQMASKYQIALSQEERTKVKEAAAEYIASLNDEETGFCQADEEDAGRLIQRIALADKVFAELTEEEEIEVSDDEARVVTFRHIMIKKATEDAYTKILTIQDLLSQGADFDSAAEQYSEDVRTEYTVGRGKLDAGLEDEIFSMEDGEMSIVLESSEGYHIVLCVSSFNREATEQNKKVLLAQKKWEAFEETYNAFARKQTCEFKEKRWEEIHLDGQDISGTKFYDIYENYF